MWDWLTTFFKTVWKWLVKIVAFVWSWLSVCLDIALVILVFVYTGAGIYSLFAYARTRCTHKDYNAWGSRSPIQAFIAWLTLYRFPLSQGAHWYSPTRLIAYMALFYVCLNIVECLAWSFRHTQMINSFDDGTYYEHFPQEADEEEEDDEMRRVPPRFGSSEWNLLVHVGFLTWVVLS